MGILTSGLFFFGLEKMKYETVETIIPPEQLASINDDIENTFRRLPEADISEFELDAVAHRLGLEDAARALQCISLYASGYSPEGLIRPHNEPIARLLREV